MPTWPAIAAAVRALSPVIITVVEAQAVQRGDGRHRVGFDGVGDGEHAGGLAVDRDEDGGLALARRTGSATAWRGCGVDAGVGEQPGGADQYRAAVDGGPDALAGDRGEPGHRRQVQAALAGGGDDRGRERVFAVGSRPRPPARSRVVSSKPSSGLHVGQRRFAGGDGAGLVQHDGVELVRGLQGLGGADQDAGLGALPGRRP